MNFAKKGLCFAAVLAFASNSAIAGNVDNDFQVAIFTGLFKAASPVQDLTGKWDCHFQAAYAGTKSEMHYTMEFKSEDENRWRWSYSYSPFHDYSSRVERFSREGATTEVEGQFESGDILTANFRSLEGELIVELRGQIPKQECDGNDRSQVLPKYPVGALMRCKAYVAPPPPAVDKQKCCVIF